MNSTMCGHGEVDLSKHTNKIFFFSFVNMDIDVTLQSTIFFFLPGYRVIYLTENVGML